MNWHRLFGLILTDFFTDSPYLVELEKDLALKKQLLDVVVLRRGPGRFAGRLPDGLDDLAEHNLITFKSHQEALDDWALKELTGHYVNYRKQCGPVDEPLLPERVFRMYAVCSWYPHNLANEVPLEQVQEGVYQCRRGTDMVRIVVAGQVPKAKHNALLHLFSASVTVMSYGAEHYRQRSQETSTLLDALLVGYQGERIAMAYTMEDWRRDYILEFLKYLTPEDRRKALQTLPLEERLAGLTPRERRKALQTLLMEERLAGLTPQEIAKFLEEMEGKRSSRRGRSRRGG